MHKSRTWQALEIITPYLCIILLTVAILYPQIRSKVYLAGYDAWFHMNQVYDTAMQFKTGNFSYFLSLFGFGGVGRIVNAIYGPGFMYLGGLILLLAKTWYRFEIVQDFLGLILGGSFFYILTRKNYVNRLTGTLLSLMYMMSNVVMTWVINQEFDGIEAILMPLIILQGTQMARTKEICPFALGVTMAIAFQTHMMTTLIGTLTLIPFFIYTWIKTIRKTQLWKHLVMSIGLTALLTANVWGAMLNVMPQGLVPPVPQQAPSSGGALIWMGHYFSVIGLGYSVIVTTFVIICGLSLFRRHSNSIYKIALFLGVFWIWVASGYFPWRAVYRIYPAFVYQIQFPKRFLCVGVILLFLTVGMLFSNHDVQTVDGLADHRMWIAVQIILLAFFAMGYAHQKSLFDHDFSLYRSSQVIDYNPFYTYHYSPKGARRLRADYHSPHCLGTALNMIHQDTPDYLPTYKVVHTYRQYRYAGLYSGVQRQIYGDFKYLDVHRQVSNHHLVMTWNQKRYSHDVLVPLIKYRNTQVKLDHHVVRKPPVSRIGAINFRNVQPGLHQVELKYQTPIWMQALIGTTVLSWLWIVVQALHKLYKKIRNSHSDDLI